MSIQSTRFITRKEAEVRLARAREADISNLSDVEIENELDEQLYNYSIVEEGNHNLNN